MSWELEEFLSRQERLRDATAALDYLSELPWHTFHKHRLLIAAGAVHGDVQEGRKFLSASCAGWFDNTAFHQAAGHR